MLYNPCCGKLCSLQFLTWPRFRVGPYLEKVSFCYSVTEVFLVYIMFFLFSQVRGNPLNIARPRNPFFSLKLSWWIVNIFIPYKRLIARYGSLKGQKCCYQKRKAGFIFVAELTVIVRSPKGVWINQIYFLCCRPRRSTWRSTTPTSPRSPSLPALSPTWPLALLWPWSGRDSTPSRQVILTGGSAIRILEGWWVRIRGPNTDARSGW